MRNIFRLAISMFLFAVCIGKPSMGHTQSVSIDAIKDQMVKDWERAKSYTGEYLQSMPADKYSFKAVDSIRSFAQQMLHLAQANIFFASTASGNKPLYQGYNLETHASAQSKDSVVYYVNSSYDYVISNLKNVPAAQFAETVKAFGNEIPRSILFLKAFEHQTHHRGQTTIYIRLAGIRPPAERLF